MIISDRPNFIFYLLQNELNISQKMYLSMRPLPQLFPNNIELNPNYIPNLGSNNLNIMNYVERCSNFFLVLMINLLIFYQIMK